MDLQNWACLNMLVIFGVHKNTPEWCLMVSRCFSDTPELKNYSSNINQLVGWSNQVMNSVPGDSILGLNHRIFRAAVFQANPTREKCRILEKSRWEKSRWAGKNSKPPIYCGFNRQVHIPEGLEPEDVLRKRKHVQRKTRERMAKQILEEWVSSTMPWI